MQVREWILRRGGSAQEEREKEAQRDVAALEIAHGIIGG
jgi:hypothetical protein